MKIVLPRASRGYVFQRLFYGRDERFRRRAPAPIGVLSCRHARARAWPKRERSKRSSPLHRGSRAAFKARQLRLGRRPAAPGALDAGQCRPDGTRAGRGRREEQMEFVLPVTLLAYKPGFPAEIRRQRNVHQFIYELLNARVAEAGYESPQRELSEFFDSAFGPGVEIGDAPKYDGKYRRKVTCRPASSADALSLTGLRRRRLGAAGRPECGTGNASKRTEAVRRFVAVLARVPGSPANT